MTFDLLLPRSDSFETLIYERLGLKILIYTKVYTFKILLKGIREKVLLYEVIVSLHSVLSFLIPQILLLLECTLSFFFLKVPLPLSL